ncbi:MAG: class I SAM-dependent methyltransferase [Flavobacteriales bacterium]
MTDPKEIAKNLRTPEGAVGKQIGEFMNKGNIHSYNRMKEHLQYSSASNVLEIGFGNGLTSKELMRGCNYVGLDYSADMVAEAKVLCAQEIKECGAELMEGDIHAMPFANNAFDVIFTINTIYFWDKPELAVSELRRVLKEGGKLYIGMRTKEDMEALSVFTQYGFNIRSLHTVEELLRAGGFSDIKYTVYSDPLNQRADGSMQQLHSVIFEVA